MRLLSGHILPRNASNFTCSHRYEKFSRTPAYRGGEGKRKGGEWVKGILPLKIGERKGQERKIRRRK